MQSLQKFKLIPRGHQTSNMPHANFTIPGLVNNDNDRQDYGIEQELVKGAWTPGTALVLENITRSKTLIATLDDRR
jgi:hypothetical protein